MKITENSRKHPRVSARGLLKYTLGPASAPPQVMNILEISEGGLSFLTDLKLESGTKIPISLLLLPYEDPFDINTVVVHSFLKNKKTSTHRTSLRFLDMTETNRMLLRDRLEHFLKHKKKSTIPRFVFRRRS